jgi:Protein of unknown function (DUF1566)
MKPLKPSLKSLLPCLAVLLMGLTAGLSVQAQSRYTYSANGSEVTDSQTGLIWRRCSAGQSWTGTGCAADSSQTSFTHEAALVYARNQTGWRLPNVKELRSLLLDSSPSSSFSIDAVAFPNIFDTDLNGIGVYWSSTPNVQQSTSAWAVRFLPVRQNNVPDVGSVSSQLRNASLNVRLVR